MIQATIHNVSSCLWNTSFDDKQRGSEMQSMLSNWSKHLMPNTIEEVFEEVCPENMTLRIQQLELDLGEVSYDYFTEEITLKLKEALRQQLIDLLRYPNKTSRTVEILTQETSLLQILKHYLQQGILPWNAQTEIGSLNTLLAQQLQEHKDATATMLWDVGTAEQVRKRLAWNISENNFRRIIAVLEPNNNEVIIDFSKEFIKVQQKETVVSSGTQDFKRNTWFWILNYLFVDRGTMFNRESFVKSAILQMAQHFNMEYITLFEIIEEAIHSINESTYVNAEFIYILKSLSKEIYTGKLHSTPSQKQETVYWGQLKEMLLRPNSISTETNRKRFNHLLATLYQLDISYFKTTLLSLPKEAIAWQRIFNKVEDNNIPIFFKTVLPYQANAIITQVQLLVTIDKAHLSAKTIWAKSFSFLLQNRSSTGSASSFMAKLIAKDKQLYKSLQQNEAPLFLKSHTHISVLKLQEKLQQDWYLNEASGVAQKHVKAVWQEYINLKLGNYTNLSVLLKLEKVLLQWSITKPSVVCKIIQNNKAYIPIQYYCSKVLDEHHAALFIQKISPKNQALLQEILRVLKTSKSIILANTRGQIENRIYRIAVFLLLTERLLSVFDFTKKLLEELDVKFGKLITNTDNKPTLLTALIDGLKENSQAGVSSQQLQQLQNQFTTNATLTTLEKVIKLTTTSNAKNKVLVLLARKYRTLSKINEFVFSKEGAQIIQYILPNGVSVLKELQATNLVTLNKHHKSRLKETDVLKLYWNCLLDYGNHQGQSNKFKAFVEAVMVKHSKVYNSTNTIDKSFQITSKKHETYSNIISVSKEAQFIQALKARNYTATTNDTTTLLTKVFETDFEVVIPLFDDSKFKMYCLQQLVFLQVITLCVENTKQHSSTVNLVALKALYIVIQQIARSSIKSYLENYFWNLLFDTKATVTKKALQKIIKEILAVFVNESKITAGFLVEKIREKQLQIPYLLKELLSEENEAFLSLGVVEQPQESFEPKTDKAIAPYDLLDLCEYILLHKRFPNWYLNNSNIAVEVYLSQLFKKQPLLVLKVLRKSIFKKDAYLLVVVEMLAPKTICENLGALYANRKKQLDGIYKLQQLVVNNTINGISSSVISNIILLKVVQAWQSATWSMISNTKIWDALLWELCAKRNIEKEVFIKSFQKLEAQLPIPLLLTFKEVVSNHQKLSTSINTAVSTEEKSTRVMAKSTSTKYDMPLIFSQGIKIHNAGMVLLNSYFKMLFERLGLVNGEQFTDQISAMKATHYLQYLGTGIADAEEHFLPLNKVLCGFVPNEPVIPKIEVPPEEDQLIKGLINAAIGYWDAIGSSSINGFRGNWLVREGILREEEDRWTLVVDKKAYDILLTQSPFACSIIKYPWMPKPLHVSWPY